MYNDQRARGTWFLEQIPTHVSFVNDRPPLLMRINQPVDPIMVKNGNQIVVGATEMVTHDGWICPGTVLCQKKYFASATMAATARPEETYFSSCLHIFPTKISYSDVAVIGFFFQPNIEQGNVLRKKFPAGSEQSPITDLNKLLKESQADKITYLEWVQMLIKLAD